MRITPSATSVVKRINRSGVFGTKLTRKGRRNHAIRNERLTLGVMGISNDRLRWAALRCAMAPFHCSMWILLSRMTCPQRAISRFNSALAAAGER